ncbi:MAG: hypothetical protein ACKOA2_01130 [Ilumatobacteraceae bacterium]
MRRTLASLLFGLAFATAGATLAGFLVQRVALSPARAGDAADAILGDEAIRAELVRVVADEVTAAIAVSDPQLAATLRTNIETVVSLPAGQALLAGVITDAHARLIGARDEPVVISGEQLVQITRDERAAVIPPIVLEVPTITALDVVRSTLRWLVPIGALATVVLALIGLAAHPDSTEVLRSLAAGLVGLAVLAAVLGYLVPKFVVPVLDDSPWAEAPARLADDSLPLLIGLELVLIGGALAAAAASGMSRRSRRWSAPVASHRYGSGDDRRWH